MTRVSSWILGVMAVTLALSVDTARATTIFSEDFEATVLAEGAKSAPSGWACADTAKIWRPGTAAAPGQFNQTEPMASPAGGTNILELDCSTTDSYVYRNIGTVAANTDYKVTMAIGWSNAYSSSGGLYVTLYDYTSQIQYGSMAVTSTSNQGGWENRSFTVSHTNANLQGDVGNPFSLWLWAVEGNPVYVDNIRVEASTIPEPSTLLLAAFGLLGLLAYAWRKRRQY